MGDRVTVKSSQTRIAPVLPSYLRPGAPADRKYYSGPGRGISTTRSPQFVYWTYSDNVSVCAGDRFIMKHSSVEAMLPSVVNPCFEPLLYSTHFATYTSSIVSNAVLSDSFSFEIRNFKYEELSLDMPYLSTVWRNCSCWLAENKHLLQVSASLHG